MNTLIFAGLLAGLAVTGKSIPPQNTESKGSLRTHADRIGLDLGTCVGEWQIRGNVDQGRYRRAVTSQVNMIEPENDLKPASLWKGIGQYDFSKPDYLLGAPGGTGWAQQNNLSVRGHVLLYPIDTGYTTPAWLIAMENQLTSAQVKDILRDYIYAVAGRYAGKIKSWDVINEAIADSQNSRPYNLRDSFWYRKLGTEFLTLAFKYAHEADPNAKLYYNDYNIEKAGWKATSAINLAKFVRSQGGQVDGIGMQYHTVLSEAVLPGGPHYQMVANLVQENFSFMITELDVRIQTQPYANTHPMFGKIPLRASDLNLQATNFLNVFKLGLSSPNCKGIQMWGITDNHSWIPNFMPGFGAALLLDWQYKSKPAHRALLEYLRGRSQP